jgi:ribose-phosphate pyrophosphokinase
MLIAGSNHKELNEEIAARVGVALAKASIKRFADGEVSIQIDENVRGRHVFVLQSCAAPVNDSILELLLTVAAVRRSSASRVTAVIPYFGYKHHRYLIV